MELLCLLYAAVSLPVIGPVDCSTLTSTREVIEFHHSSPDDGVESFGFSSKGFRYRIEVEGEGIPTYFEIEGPLNKKAQPGLTFRVRF